MGSGFENGKFSVMSPCFCVVSSSNKGLGFWRGILGFAVLRFWPFFASIFWSYKILKLGFAVFYSTAVCGY